MNPRKPALGFIFITLVLDVLGFGLLIPVAPKLIQGLLHDGQGGTAAEASTMFSLLMSTWYAMAFLFSPILGGLSDRFGRRPVILLALLGSGLDFFAQGLSTTLTILFITRAINGVTGASFTVANAYIADITPPEKRAAAFGLVGAAFGLGFVAGPAIGGVLGNYDVRLPFFVAGGLTLLNALYGYFVLPESLPPERRSPFHVRKAHPVAAYARLRHYPLVLGLAMASFLFHLAQIGLHATWALSMAHRFGWTPLGIGMSLMAVGIASAIVQGGLAGPLVKRMGEGRAAIFGCVMGVLCFIGYGLAPEGWVIYVIVTVGSIGGIGQPAVQALITRAVPPTEQGAIQGTMMSLQSIAGILGPLISGAVFSYFVTAPLDFGGAPFIAGAVLCAIGTAVAVVAIGRHGGHRPSPGAEPQVDEQTPRPAARV